MLKTFSKGGIHPAENKFSAGNIIEKLSLPTSVTIPISQHIGAPATVLVKRGDMVKTGQLIAQSSGFVSANIHSSVTGTVSKIDEIFDASGYRRPAVVIEVSPDEWTDGIDNTDTLITEINLTPKEIIRRIEVAGLVGLGGATFPSHVKLTVPSGKKIEYLIINGAECEPYLTADHALMLEKGEEIITGVRLLMLALGISKTFIGIENNKPDAIKNLSRIAAQHPGLQVQALKTKYPQGGEKQLIKALINREVPSGRLPLDVEAVVFNVGSAFAVYEAVQKNKPLIERIVTVTGKNVSKPSNFKVRIGTPISQLIESAGGVPDQTGKIINGGPMMGKAIFNLSTPVTKGTSGIIMIPESESTREPIQVCIRCAKCVGVCPMGLEPNLLMAKSTKKMYEELGDDRILDCVECGSCSFICPANRPLLDYIRLGKSNLNRIIRSRKTN